MQRVTPFAPAPMTSPPMTLPAAGVPAVLVSSATQECLS